MNSSKIVNVVTPTLAADAANKSYVDGAETRATAVGSAAKTTADGLVTATRLDAATVSAQFLAPPPGNDAGIRTNNAWRIYVNPQGNVGIGTSHTSPSVPLDVAGTTKISTGLVIGSTGDSSVLADGSLSSKLVIYHTAESRVWLTHGTSAGLLIGHNSTAGSFINNRVAFGELALTCEQNIPMKFKTSNTDRMTITGAGLVGIGTTTPSCPLHVFGAITNTITGTTFFLANNSLSGFAGSTTGISLITENSIWNKGSFIWITSDQRIKTNIVNLSADKMMNIFRTLRPISFDFIDPMKNNNKKHFGFIAQEVNEVLPEGISINTDVIPNNMMKGGITKPSETDENPSFTLKPTDTDISLNYLLVTTDKPIIFDISNSYSSKDIYKFKVYCGKEWSKEHDIYIRSDYNVIDDKYIYVIGMKKDVYDVVLMEPTLFVYGQYVYDLHILEHDTIYTVATAALQEVDRQQQADKARIAELESTVATQQSLINDILERLKALEKA